MIYPYKGKYPVIHPSVFLTDDVMVVGDVTIEADASVWFGCVIRGDVNTIRIGQRTNIQDNCTLHVTAALDIGAGVTVGHGAILHGCTIHDSCLIGMGAKILDGAVVHSESLVAAGSLVLQNTVIHEGKLFGGVPAKPLRNLTTEERAHIRRTSEYYLSYIAAYRLHGDMERGITNREFLQEMGRTQR